jgi:hypothetical protein
MVNARKRLRIKVFEIMKNFEEFGMQEMDTKEMRTVDGGALALLAAAIGLYLAVEIAGNPKAHVEAFKRGWNAG